MTLKMYDLAAADPAIRFSPHCWRTRIAITHKGLDLDCVAWRFVEKEVLSPTGQGVVPVLVDGETWVSDSSRIVAYVDRNYPEHPLFESPQARAHACFIETWTNQVVNLGIIKQILCDVFSILDEGDKPYFRETREKRFGVSLEQFRENADATLTAYRASLAPLRATLQAQNYLSGDEPSYADYVVFGAFQWARVASTRKLLEAEDPILAWRDRLLAAFEGLAGAMPARGDQ